jgi:PAS domain S-box-containing protein
VRPFFLPARLRFFPSRAASLEKVLCHAPVVLFMLDRDGVFLRSEGKGLDALGLRQGEVLGRNVREVYAGVPQLLGNVDRALRGEAVRDLVHAGGRSWDTTYEPLRDDDGEVVGVLGVALDVTERHHAQEEVRRVNEQLEALVADRTAQLRTANGELQSFAHTVSHDLRAPLRNIDAFSQALLEQHAAALTPDGRDLVQRIRAATARMYGLIEDLLNLSRVTQVDLVREPVDLSSAARAILDRLRQQDPSRRVQAAVQQGLREQADPALVQVLLENLLENAWKFTSKRPSAVIEVGAEDAEGRRVYYVRDDGVGFEATQAHTLFRPFHRLHHTSEYEGSGIGLATVLRIAARHGGTAWAEAAPGRGATIRFTLAPPSRLAPSG